MNEKQPEVAPEHRAPRVHALHVAAAVAVLVLGGAIAYALVRRHLESAAWEQAVSDASAGLERCLLGAPLAAGETADARIRAIALVNPPSDTGWPGQCRVLAARLYDLTLSGDPRLAPMEETLFRIKTLRELPEVGDLFEQLRALELPPPQPSNDPVAPPPTRTVGPVDFPVVARNTGTRMLLPRGVPSDGAFDVLLLGPSRYLCTVVTPSGGGSIDCRLLRGELDASDLGLLEREPGGPALVERRAPDADRSGGVYEVKADGSGRRVDPGVDAAAARTAFGRGNGEIVWLGRLDATGYLWRRLRGGERVEESELALSGTGWPGPFASVGRLLWIEQPSGRGGRSRLHVAPLPVGGEVEVEPAAAEGAPETEEPAEEGEGLARPRRAVPRAVRLGEVPARAELEAACASADTFTAVLHASGSYERWIVFHDPSGWAPIARVRIGAPHLCCGLGSSTLVRGDSGRLTMATCGSDGCQVREHALASLEVGAGPLDAAPVGDREVIVAYGGARGGLRFRVGLPSAIAGGRDTVVADDAAHGGFDVSEVFLVPRGDHAVLLVRDGAGGVRALRVGAGGAVEPIAPARR